MVEIYCFRDLEVVGSLRSTTSLAIGNGFIVLGMNSILLSWA